MIKYEKKIFTKQKTGRDKAQIIQDFRIILYINNIMHTAIVRRRQKSEQY